MLKSYIYVHAFQKNERGEKMEKEGNEMKHRKRDEGAWWIALLLVGVMIAGSVGAYMVLYGNTNGEKKILTISGSTTVQPIASKAAEKFMDAHPNVDIRVSGGGSSVGVTSVGSGNVDIGMASRDLKSSEKAQYPTLLPTTIAKDGIAVIVHPSNSISNLSLEQIRGIYNGTYKNWKQLGGDDKEIVVYGRDSTSGTREFFWEHVMKKENFTVTLHELNSNGAVKTAVSQNDGAIGYVGLGYIDTSVKALKIDNEGQQVEANVANVLNGKYPISRSLYFITRGTPEGLAKEFIDYVLSPEGQKIVEDEGFVPLRK
jgi:phosphate transport system substrate-binding protein